MALLERFEKLYVAVVADCLDRVGVRRNLLAPHVRSLYPGARLAGYALTVHVVEVGVPADRGTTGTRARSRRRLAAAR